MPVCLPKVMLIASLLVYNLSALSILGVEPALGYEESIFNQILIPAYGLLLVSSAMAATAILLAVKYRQYGTAALGHLVLFIASLTFLLLPVMRGYYSFGRGDLLTHVGFIEDILIVGHIPSYDYGQTTPFLAGYPGIHFYLASLLALIGVPSQAVPFLIGPMIYGFLLISVTVTSYGLRLGRIPTLLALIPVHFLPIGMVWIYSLPVAAAISVTPLFVGLMLHSGRTAGRYLVLASVFGFAYILIHPLIAVGVLAILVLIYVFKALIGYLTPQSQSLERITSLPIALVIASILWLSWNSVIWRTSILSIVSAWESQSQIELVSGAIGGTGLGLLELGGLATISFWPHLVILILALAALTIKGGTNEETPPGPSRMRFYLLLATSVAAATLVTLILGFAGFGAWRFGALFMVLLVPVSGRGICRLLNFPSASTAGRALKLGVVAFVVSGIVVAPFAYFPSPITGRPNDQVTEAEAAAYAWLATLAPASDVSHIFNSRFWTTVYAERGYLYAQQAGIARVSFVPPHLAYQDPCYSESRTIVPLSSFSIHYYTELYPDSEVISREEMLLFINHPCTSHIYTNGGSMVILT